MFLSFQSPQFVSSTYSTYSYYITYACKNVDKFQSWTFAAAPFLQQFPFSNVTDWVREVLTCCTYRRGQGLMLKGVSQTIYLVDVAPRIIWSWPKLQRTTINTHSVCRILVCMFWLWRQILRASSSHMTFIRLILVWDRFSPSKSQTKVRKICF